MLKDRFRKFLPVVVDLETGGFDAVKNPILEIAIQLIDFEDGKLTLGQLHRHHIKPFEGLEINQDSIDFLNLDLNHPLRVAADEKEALLDLFQIINKHKNLYECSRAILVGHNAFFDHSFLLAACERHGIKKFPFHPFSLIDTVARRELCVFTVFVKQICGRLRSDR